MGGAISMRQQATSWVTNTPVDEYGNTLSLGKGVELLAQRLALSTPMVVQLYRKFNEIDYDLSGSITIQEFCSNLQVEPSDYVWRLFQMIDQNCSGELDFQEFLAGVWNICTFDEEAPIRFAFQLYDYDDDDEPQQLTAKDQQLRLSEMGMTGKSSKVVTATASKMKFQFRGKFEEEQQVQHGCAHKEKQQKELPKAERFSLTGVVRKGGAVSKPRSDDRGMPFDLNQHRSFEDYMKHELRLREQVQNRIQRGSATVPPVRMTTSMNMPKLDLSMSSSTTISQGRPRSALTRRKSVSSSAAKTKSKSTPKGRILELTRGQGMQQQDPATVRKARLQEKAEEQRAPKEAPLTAWEKKQQLDKETKVLKSGKEEASGSSPPVAIPKSAQILDGSFTLDQLRAKALQEQQASMRPKTPRQGWKADSSAYFKSNRSLTDIKPWERAEVSKASSAVTPRRANTPRSQRPQSAAAGRARNAIQNKIAAKASAAPKRGTVKMNLPEELKQYQIGS